MPDPLRIAVVSTPRSGNTWLRAMLSHMYGVPTAATHELADDDWGRFPPEVVHQIPWPRTPEFLAKLRGHGFRVVTLARHPLDTLVSILHFAWYDRETANWLLGCGGDEAGLRGAMPRSRPFLDYAAGPRAAALLAVTGDWWGQEGVTSVRYEDLVADTAGQLAALAEVFGPPRCESLAGAVAACAMGQLRKQSLNNHFWQGKPGLWRDLLPAPEAGELAAALAPVLTRLGYGIDPDPALDAGAADRNWVGAGRRRVGPDPGGGDGRLPEPARGDGPARRGRAPRRDAGPARAGRGGRGGGAAPGRHRRGGPRAGAAPRPRAGVTGRPGGAAGEPSRRP